MSTFSFQHNELWEITRRLVHYNTVSANSNVEAAEYLADILKQSGFTVHLYREVVDAVPKATVIAYIGPAAPGGLIISGHTDVVPFEGQPGWRTDPLELHTDGERIFGRGVTDMKVFLAQALVAARELPLAQLQRPLVYIFTCDEEVAGQGSGRLIKVLPRFFKDVPLPEVALIGEPTSYNIFPAHKGYASFEILVRGRGGHSSMPDRGLNAIVNMAHVIQTLQEVHHEFQAKTSDENRHLFPDNPATSFNCAVIQGGLAANMIAETCTLTVSVRVAPGDDADALLTQLQERIDRDITRPMQSVDPDCMARIENYIAVPPLQSPIEHPFCSLLSRVIGRSVERGAPYATDGGYFQQLGISSYICGPGLLDEAHQPNESLPVEAFLSGVEYLKRIITGWCMDETTL